MSTDQTLRVFIKEKNIETPYFEMKEELEEESIKQEEEQLPVSAPEFFSVCVKTEEASPFQPEFKQETQDISTEPHLHPETEGDTEHSSEYEEGRRAPSSCSDDEDFFNHEIPHR
uniref:Uncharacterized protein n=1 Tax=Knipowitschia caucasica TaxID=637954 RepID=A0AAV2JWD8_KNICA